MKQLMIAIVILFCSISFAQVDTQGETLHIGQNGSKVIYFYESGFTDSTETYYTRWYDFDEFWGDVENIALGSMPQYAAFIERSSVSDTASVYVIIEGRMGTDGTNANSDAADVDTLGTYNTVGDEWVLFDMNGWKPMQIRVQLQGHATANTTDAIVRGWLVLKRPNTAVQVPR